MTLWDEEDGFFYDVLHLPDGRPAAQGALDGRAHPAVRGRDARARDASIGCPASSGACSGSSTTGRSSAVMSPPPWARAAASAACWRSCDGPSCSACSATCSIASEFLSPLRHPRALALPPRASLRAVGRRHRAPRRLRAGRVGHRAVRRQLQLARARSGSRSTSCSSRRCRSSITSTATIFKVECPTGSGRLLNLWEVAAELSRGLTRHLPARPRRPPARLRRLRALPAATPTGATSFSSTSTSTATRAPASAPATRRAGRPWWPS